MAFAGRELPGRLCHIHGRLLPCDKCAVESPPPPPRVGIAGIFEAIAKERKFQDEKYGPVLESGLGTYYKNGTGAPAQGPGGHELGAWLIIAEKELDECKDALIHGGSKTKKGRDTIRAELVQLAAVCVAALEQHGLEEK